MSVFNFVLMLLVFVGIMFNLALSIWDLNTNPVDPVFDMFFIVLSFVFGLVAFIYCIPSFKKYFGKDRD